MVLRVAQWDLHIHSAFSDGTCEVGEVVKIAQKKGLTLYAITDHYSEFQALPRRMPKEQLGRYLEQVRMHGCPVVGVEAEILADGISISPAQASLCDLVLGGLHSLHDTFFWGGSHPIWNPQAFVEDIRITLIKAMESNLLDVLVHPTWLPEEIRSQTHRLLGKEWIRSIVSTALEHHVAIELSGAWHVPDKPFVQECLRQGVQLSVGSDAHSAAMIGNVRYALHLLKELDALLEMMFVPRGKEG